MKRGQAIAETVIFLPISLLTLWGVIWAAQYGVMSERVQAAVRYSGLISNQLDPYMQYSFYVLYNSQGAGSTNAALPSQTCVPPVTDAMSNSNTYPGPTAGPFWQNTPAPPSLSCTNANTQTAVFNIGGMNQPAIALSNIPQVTVAVNVPGFLTNPTLGFTQPIISASSLPAAASLNFLKPADMGTLMTCHPGMQSQIANSLTPPLPTMSPPVPAPLAEPMPAQTAIPETC